jgi:2-methylisocitrate lyase-like PEP mutase family enzyme
MPLSPQDKRAAFRKLHESGCFIIPNPWDIGSAKALQSLGFKALASTSAGFAWSIGKADNQVTVDDVIAHLTALCDATDLPVNADFEGGFADDPDGVAKNVARAVKAGVAGLSIENSTGRKEQPLYEDSVGLARIKAARAAIDGIDSSAMLVARCEGFLHGERDLVKTVKRLVAFAEAGADCLYAPGLSTDEQIVTVVKAVAPKPVNVLAVLPTMTQAHLASLGVRRISVGGSLARAAWGGFLRAARELAASGTFTEFAHAAKGAELNGLFAEKG